MGTDKRTRQKQGRDAARVAAAEAERKQRQRRAAIRIGVLVVVVAAVIAVIAVLGGGDDGDDDEAVQEPTDQVTPAVVAPPEPGDTLTEPAECPPTDGTAPRVTTFTVDGLPDCIDPEATYTATLATNKGDIVVDLDAAEAPDAVNAFVTLARYGYYDGSAIYGTDPGAGTITGGAPQTNAPAAPGPGFEVDTDAGTAAPLGSLVLDANAGFRILAQQTTLESRGGVVIGSLDDDSMTVAQSILALHVAAPNSIFGGPVEPVIVESVTITES